jgi:hypothetical protein
MKKLARNFSTTKVMSNRVKRHSAERKRIILHTIHPVRG